MRPQRFQTLLTLALVVLGPALAVLTYWSFGQISELSRSTFFRAVIMADLVYVIVLIALVAKRVARMIAARRAKSAGSRLHLRLTGAFVLIALAPTILVAIFATVSLNFGLEGWFSDRVRQVLGNSLSAAEAYESEHIRDLTTDAERLADYLNRNKARYPLISTAELRELLTGGQQQMQRALPEAYIIDGAGTLRARGDRSYLFSYDAPSPEQIEEARADGPVIIEDFGNDELRALVYLPAFADRYLYVTRQVDGEVLGLLDETQETVRLYQQLEEDRGRLLLDFALIYLAFAAIVILAAIWGGLWFAERLARPVGRLAGAAQRVGAGDFDVRVKEESGDDEIAVLGRVFNRMTQQVKGQRDALISAHRDTENRRRLFEAVLSAVTAGVIGLDQEGRIEVMNRAASDLLGLDDDRATGLAIGEAVPDFARLFDRMRADGRTAVEDQVQVAHSDRVEDLLVRFATRRPGDSSEGYVVTFDSVTDLLSAQRMAAWADVARRIAHEIKNPLTPIQLSAERLRRKFGPALAEDRDAFEQYAEVIIRKTGDLRRIVDEFSRFARMPAPERTPQDLLRVITDAVHLQETGGQGITYTVELPEGPLMAVIDATMIGQAFTNLLKNAAEAIETRQARGDSFMPEIRLSARERGGALLIAIRDNGIGLPKGPRARLFEPYVTHREKGTGLGLPIVKKIVEEHAGTLELGHGPAFAEDGHRGAEVRLMLPLPEGAEAMKTENTQGPEKPEREGEEVGHEEAGTAAE
ncbi:MAG: PAS domain-containing sensor histidine kinase [Pseudomonadota bacterium]